MNTDGVGQGETMRERADRRGMRCQGRGRQFTGSRWGLCWLGIILVMAFSYGVPVWAQVPVTVTITSIDTELSVVGEGYYVQFRVDPAAANPSGYQMYGTITVDDGEGNTCSRTMSSGTGYANGWSSGCTLTTRTPGIKTLTATFTPVNAAQFASGSGTATHTVLKADTSVSVTSSANPSVTGQSVTFTAAVSVDAPGSGTPTGTVSFYAGGNLIATSSLSGGSATCATAFAHVASPVAITARYNGDANYNPSDNVLNPLTQTVNKATTATTVVAGASSWLGEPYTVSGTVSVTSPGAGTPTGTVTVSDGAGASCAANLVAGAWSCTLASEGSTGTRTLTAVYEGDEDFAGSTGTTSHTVSKVTTTLSVTTAPNPSVAGEAVAITATATARPRPTNTPDITATSVITP